MKEVAISCRNIRKSYGANECRVEALKGINLDVYHGQLTLMVGPSGSGKTTLLSILTTILTPDEGDLYILDQNASKMTEDEKAHLRSTSLGVVFQSLYLIPTLTIQENIALPLLVAGQSEEVASAKAMEILNQLNMTKRAHFSPLSLSRGQQQRIAIGRAMINESSILVCDEPTSSLDQASGLEIMGFLRELAHASRAVFVVTHDHRIFPFADRIVSMNDGLLTTENEI
ncbi:MAG: ABC transporter ATP-binding protein [Parachlamydia sp.]|nr:MAG: ABC transporter ATP-binding protein [Parachlamydia sp.]